MDKVTVNIATIPSREQYLRRTVDSLLQQCDHINLMLNSYEAIPKWIRMEPKVSAWLLDNSMGDGAKFMNQPDTGWLFTCDDDLIYPPDYVATTIAGAKKYGNVIVTHHGRNLKPGKRSSYLLKEDRMMSHRCLLEATKDQQLEFGGTGVMAFHMDVFSVDISRFYRKNMADIWVAIQANEEGIPIIGLSHKHGWIGYQLKHDEHTIWHDNYYDEELNKYQGELVNKYFR